MGINQSATWWVGSRIMFPVVLITGLLIVRKLRRFDLVFYFFLPALTIPIVIGFLKNDTLIAILERTLLDSPYLFFSTYMLTEPLTTPPTAKLQAIYGAIVGLLTPPQVHLGGLYFTPEIALLIGNIFSYLVSFKQRLTLSLKAILPAGTGAFDFVFATHSPLKFNPGQYMEWTLGHSHPDTRGVRRFFTIASAPSETEVRLGVKISDPSSSFKRRLQSLKPGDTIIASQLAGDFTLPDDPKIPLVFIAGGIGITPFRSMIKYLVNKNEFRPVTILYFNKTADEIAYQDTFKEANESLGVKVIYALTDKDHLPSGWTGEVGRLTTEMVTKYIPDYKSPLYYLSGPNAMVEANNKILESMGISKNNIKTDYFPGF
jgi:ferredoxin-NADP reductase